MSAAAVSAEDAAPPPPAKEAKAIAEATPDAEPGDEEKELPPIFVVTGTRTEADVFKLSRFVTLIDRDAYARMSLTVAVNALEHQIGTRVEHRTGTTGDAVVRGLAGGNLLALVDGCSLSSFWGEGGMAGDDMYGKVDADMVDRIEVVRGPGSVLYGSQALGAVINFITRSSPYEFTKGDIRAGARGKFIYTSGNTGFAWRLETFGATDKFRWLVGTSIRDLNDVRAGGRVRVQTPTSGEDYNYDMRYDFLLGKDQTLTLTHQKVHRTHTHKFFRPTQDNTNDRTAMTVMYKGKDFSDFLKGIEFKLYYQDKMDRRRWLPSDPDPKIGFASTQTYQAELQATVAFEAVGQHNVTAGTGYHLDVGESPDDEQFTLRKENWAVGPPGERKDSPDTLWHNWSAFVQDEWEPDFFEGLKVIAAGRYDFFYFVSDPYSSKYYPPEYTANPSAWASLRESQENDDFTYTDHVLTGGLGLTYSVAPWWNVIANFTAGFRHWPPKFGVTEHGNGIYAPSREGANIFSYTSEFGFKWKHKKFEGEAVAYHTWWEGFVEWKNGTYLGQDWYDWDQDGSRDAGEDILVRETSGRAYVMGIELSGTYRLRGDLDALFGAGEGWWDGLSLMGGFMWNYGKDLAPRSGTSYYEPIRHTHPARGLLVLRWEEPKKKNVWLSVTADMVRHYKRIPRNRLNGDVGYWLDPQDASKGKLRDYGLPGYSVFHFKAGWKVNENLTLNLGCENIFNKKYRRAHSRADEMGVNVIVGVDVKF
jgi:outer membrane receptor protein involved in Fe transport